MGTGIICNRLAFEACTLQAHRRLAIIGSPKSVHKEHVQRTNSFEDMVTLQSLVMI